MKETKVLEISAKEYGSFDVIVCGGGTAGCVAALAAARNGAKVLLLEASYYLGGMITMGNAGLTKFVLHARDPEIQHRVNKNLADAPESVQVVGGIPLEITEAIIASGDALGNYGTGASYVFPDPHAFKLYLFRTLREAGVTILLHSQIFQVLKEENRITGVVYLNKGGAYIARGNYVIDCTGDGDVAALAGVRCWVGASDHDITVKEELCPQGKLHEPGNMYRIGGVDFDKVVAHIKGHPECFMPHFFGQMSLEEFLENYEKGEAFETFLRFDSTVTDPVYCSARFQIYNNPRANVMVGCSSISEHNCLDPDNWTQAEYEALDAATRQLERIKAEYPCFADAYILDVPTVGIRETRHVEGEYMLKFMDIMENRDFEDTIGFSSHPIDTSPAPSFYKGYTPPETSFFRIPYLCLVAKGVDNLLMAGRSISATREAAGCIRPTVPCMIMGEAAGTAAAMLKDTNLPARNINIQALRATLKKNNVKC